MYLKRLNIHGFKSFPDKLKLEFNSGITAVVGPNGSGKSNISDAVRWVLGEQSAKSLRGSKMEDIIFTGTANRKPLNLAEVSITLDNSDKILDINSPEITVTRRVYRLGEGEYLVNGKTCRLKDIHELFTDTGIGKEGYSIIGQGRIDEILSTKSEDRRNMFEEAAGILKFKNRREEAKIKLQKESENLIRVNDIILSLETQVEPLKLQSEKAVKYLKLIEDLKLIEINLFIIETEKLENELSTVNSKLQASNNQLLDCNNELNNLKTNQQNLKSEIEDLNNNIKTVQKEFYDIKAEIDKNTNNIDLTQQQINYTVQDIKRIEEEIQKQSLKIDILNKDKQNYNSDYNSILTQLDSQNQLLTENQQNFYKLNTALNENENLIENYNNEILEKIKQIAQTKNNIQNLELNKTQLIERNNQIDIQKNDTLNQIDEKTKKFEILQQSKAENTNIEIRISNIINQATENKLKFQKDLKVNKKTLDELNSLVNQNQSNYKYLIDTQKEHRGFSESVKNILKAKDLDKHKWKGICGVIGELIEVDKEYETALEIALGANINNIIVLTENDAKLAIEYLKNIKGGRATFLPLSSIKPRYLDQQKDELLLEAGVIGIASDIIKYDSMYDNIIKNLLGKVIIVDNLENAILFSKKYNYMYRLVTLDGDLINAGGSLTGGSKSQINNNIFGRSRQLKEIELKILSLKNEIEMKKYKIKVLEDDINDCAELIDDKKQEYQDNHIQILTLGQQLNQVQKDISDLQSTKTKLISEQNNLLAQIQNTENSLAQSKTILESIEIENQNIKSKLNEFQSNIQSHKEIKEKLINDITDIKVNISSLEQQKMSLEQNLERIETDLNLIKTEITKNKTEISRLEKSKLQKQEFIISINSIIEDFYTKQSSKQIELNTKENSKKILNSNLNNIENQIEAKQNEISLIEKQIIKIENQNNKLLEAKTNIYDNIWNEYQITYDLAKEYKNNQLSNSQLQKESKRLKNEIKDLGNINIDAIEQYKTISERFEFLTSQRDDIVKAEQKLKKIIDELTNSMTKQFTEQFNLISQNFSDVFAELFGGGKAYLELTGTDILEAGIDIIAQPPGKNLQNMLLLSGGERALTAIALLFAILKLKPSPFCILDEIEAALDDANVNRYAEYLKKFSKVTQFIVVTHRKGTMEAADTLYGVTMQEQGVSKLVSVKFETA